MDPRLVERAKAGDRDAYEALARASADRMYAIARGITRDPDRAADAVQQALIAMWRDLPSLRDTSRFEAWSYRLAVRASLQDLRRTVRLRSLAFEPRAGGGDPAGDVALRDQLERGLAALTPDQRAVVVLRYYVGLSTDEVADVLVIPRGTVASRLHHATNALRAAIEAGNRPAFAGGQPS